MATVFLVDDDDSVRKALARALKEEGFDVQAYGSADAFLAAASSQPRGCIVLDVSMPEIDGFQLKAHLASRGTPPPIVFLTGHGDIPMSVRALKRGAADFLTKPVSIATLVAAINDALANDASARRDDSAHAEMLKNYESLTGREREVLAALVAGKINKQIADELGVVEQTVKFHRARIMKRMQARTAAELMHMVARLGVRPDGDKA